MIVLFNSACPRFIFFCIGIGIITYIIPILSSPKPYPLDERIVYQQCKWLIQQRFGVVEVYERMLIAFDTGFFIFMVFFKENQKKTIRIVFIDQMHQDDYRKLRLLERVASSVKKI